MNVATVLVLSQIPYYIILSFALKEIRKMKNTGLNSFLEDVIDI